MTGELDRVAMISLHTSPLERPGTGDAGGLNVYVLEASRRLARRGIAVEIFTRTSSHRQDPIVEIEAGLTVRHITAGPYEGLSKQDLPGQLCAFAAGLMRTGAHAPEDHYSVVHSHYWLSGQVGWLAADRWGVPLVHTMHTMARVKNAHRPLDDPVEPAGREIGEAQVVEAADQLVANTDEEARELIELYDAPPAKVAVVPPGVDLDLFTPGSKVAARAALGIRVETALLLFVGRIQPLKAPDILIRAAAHILHERPSMADLLHVAIVGGASGSGLARPDALRELSGALGLIDRVRFVEPVERDRLALWYRAADLVVVPSYSESFGLVAVEALACGTPVVAADVGGLPTAVGDGGVLVPGHDPSIWAAVLGDLLCDPARLAQLSARGIEHAQRYSWDATADRLERVYRRALERRDPTSIDDAMVLASEPTAVLP